MAALEKQCRTCGEVKPLTEFYANGRKGHKAHCKPCLTVQAGAWNAANVEARRRIMRRSRLRARYGIDDVQYDAILAYQGGGCAICRVERVAGEEFLPVDHDAGTGAVRGLLCHPCNLGIGKFRHDPQLMAAAVAYLADPPAAQVSCPPRVPYSRNR